MIAFLRKDEGVYFRTLNLAAGRLMVRRDLAQPLVEQNLEEVSVLTSDPTSNARAIVQGFRNVLAPLPEVLSQLARLLGTEP